MLEQLREGQYFGVINHKTSFNGVNITDTEYTHEYVDWHCHENPYFTFLLQGTLIEENKKESYTLSQGSLLFHNWQDYHRNIKPPEFTRGAHIEINRSWLANIDLSLDEIEGSLKINNPIMKNIAFQILLESKTSDNYNQASIELLLLDILSNLRQFTENNSTKKPKWFKKLGELMYENQDNKISIKSISSELGIHPVHLSRTFHKHYRASFGHYCREIRLNRAINYILLRKHNLTDIAYLTHYFDQSHMTDTFKKRFKTTPKELSRIIG